MYKIIRLQQLENDVAVDAIGYPAMTEREALDEAKMDALLEAQAIEGLGHQALIEVTEGVVYAYEDGRVVTMWCIVPADDETTTDEWKTEMELSQPF